MRVGIIGSGTVGQTLGSGFIKLGHEVLVGTRDPQKLKDWAEKNGPSAKVGSFSEAAEYCEMAVVATLWSGTESALSLAGPERLAGKIVIDVTNPLDFSKGAPPQLAADASLSGGERIQRWLPASQVVKAFNIITARYMIDARLEEGIPDMFIAGNDAVAKAKVADIARAWHWANVHDLGDIKESYWLETFAMLWIRLGFKNNQWTHAFKMLKH